MRRAAAGVLVFAGLAGAGLGYTMFADSGPKHPSSALGFRNLHEQRQFVRSELIRLEPAGRGPGEDGSPVRRARPPID